MDGGGALSPARGPGRLFCALLLAASLPAAVLAMSRGGAEPPRLTAADLPEPALETVPEATAAELRELRRHVADRLEETEDQRQVATAVGELGRAYLSRGLRPAAEECLLTAAALAPRDLRWAYYLGFVHEGDGRLQEAARFYERALSISPGKTTVVFRLGSIYAALDRVEAAEWLLREVLADEPDHAAAQAALGELLVGLGRPAEAAALLESALELQPGADRLYRPLALAYRGLGRREEARSLMERLGEGDVRSADELIDGLDDLAVGERLHLLRGRAAYRAGSFEEAAAEFRRAAESAPDSVAAYLNLGAALGRLDEEDASLEAYRRAVELAPRDKTAHQALGRLLARREELPAALEHLTAAAAVDPADGQLQLELAEVLNRSGRAQQALASFQRAAELDPPGEMARFREAQLLTASGRYGEALATLEKGYELAPDSSLLALTLGRLLASAPDLALRDGERALRVLTRAPIRRSVRSLETMAMAYAEVGRCFEAVEWQSQAWEATYDADRTELSDEMEAWVEHYRNARPCRYPAGGGLDPR